MADTQKPKEAEKVEEKNDKKKDDDKEVEMVRCITLTWSFIWFQVWVCLHFESNKTSTERCLFASHMSTVIVFNSAVSLQANTNIPAK